MESPVLTLEEYIDILFSPGTDIHMLDFLAKNIDVHASIKTREDFLWLLHRYSIIPWRKLRMILSPEFQSAWVDCNGYDSVYDRYKSIIKSLPEDKILDRLPRNSFRTDIHTVISSIRASRCITDDIDTFLTDKSVTMVDVIAWGIFHGLSYVSLKNTYSTDVLHHMTALAYLCPISLNLTQTRCRESATVQLPSEIREETRTSGTQALEGIRDTTSEQTRTRDITPTPPSRDVLNYTGPNISSSHQLMSLIRRGYNTMMSTMSFDISSVFLPSVLREVLMGPIYPPLLDFNDISLAAIIPTYTLTLLGISSRMSYILHIMDYSFDVITRGYFVHGISMQDIREDIPRVERLTEKQKIALYFSRQLSIEDFHLEEVLIASRVIYNTFMMKLITMYIDEDVKVLANKVGMIIPPEMNPEAYFWANISRYETVTKRPSNLSPLTIETSIEDSHHYTDKEIIEGRGLYSPYMSRADILQVAPIYISLQKDTMLQVPQVRSEQSSKAFKSEGIVIFKPNLGYYTLADIPELLNVDTLDIMILSRRFPEIMSAVTNTNRPKLPLPNPSRGDRVALCNLFMLGISIRGWMYGLPYVSEQPSGARVVVIPYSRTRGHTYTPAQKDTEKSLNVCTSTQKDTHPPSECKTQGSPVESYPDKTNIQSHPIKPCTPIDYPYTFTGVHVFTRNVITYMSRSFADIHTYPIISTQYEREYTICQLIFRICSGEITRELGNVCVYTSIYYLSQIGAVPPDFDISKYRE